MPLFRSREDKFLWSLTKGVRLLLPADPGQDALLDTCRQFSPAARPSKMNREWICADGEHFRLHRVTAVGAELGMRAGLPPDIGWAVFTDWDGAYLGLDTRGRKLVDEEYREKARYLLGGLAARFGGLWAPHPEQAAAPLRAYVYTVRALDAAGLLGLACRHAPGLSPAEERSDGVITVRGGGAVARVRYWPPFPATLPKSELVAGPGAPEVLDPAWPEESTAVITVEAEQPAAGAGTGVARALGEMALGLAAQTGGVCVDVFGFRVREPGDLVIRAT